MHYSTKVTALLLSIILLSPSTHAKKPKCGAHLIQAIITKKDPSFFSKQAINRQVAQQISKINKVLL